MKRYLGKRNLTGWIVLITCLAITLLAWQNARERNLNNAREQFNLYVSDVNDAILDRLKDQHHILLGGAGLFETQRHLTRQEWHDYIKKLNLEKNYPGILGVGYSQIVKPADVTAFETRIRAQGFPDFHIKPVGKRAIYSAIVFLEPFSGRNLAAFGYDMLSQETRAKAMITAARTGTAIISGKVTLVQETHGKVQAGFLMYEPIYYKNMPLNTPEQRWKALKGFVYSPYRVDDLMNGLLGRSVPEVEFSIYDGKKASDESLMYDSSEFSNYPNKDHVPVFQDLGQINIYGHTWTVRYVSSPSFENRFQSNIGWVILILGSISALLLFLLVSSLQFRRERAEEMARAMTIKIRQDEEMLRASEERFDLAVRASTEGIWDWDISNHQYYYSPKLRELLGAEESGDNIDLLSRHLYQSDPYANCNSLRLYLKENNTFSVTCRMKDGNGDWRWFRNRGIAVRNKSGEPVRIVGSLLEITESKRAEQLILDSHTHTQAILDNVIDGIFTVDKDGVILSINLSCAAIFAYHPDELPGKPITTLFPDYYSKQCGELFSSNFAIKNHKKDTASNELEGIRKDGSIFPIELSVSQIKQEGNAIFIGLVRDITERKKIERLKSEFVSTVSHELRTPLTSIKGALSLVLGKSGNELSEKSRGMLETATRNSERLSLLINDILDLEKIESGKLEFKFQPLDLINIANQAVENNQSYGQENNITINLSTKLKQAMVWGDSNRLQQVFANLLSNAIKFSARDTQVEIEISRNGRNFVVCINDNGKGIPEEFQSKIFQRFAQADSSDTREKGGTGLGLSITKAIVERHGGYINYKNRPTGGAQFYFEIHEYRSHINTDTAHHIEQMLVCHGDIDQGRLINNFFLKQGAISSLAVTIQDTLSLLQEGNYQAILINMDKPSTPCLDILEEIRQQPDAPVWPIITITNPLAASSDNKYATAADQKTFLHKLGDILYGTHHIRILHVSDNASQLRDMQVLARSQGIDYEYCYVHDEFESILNEMEFDLIILDCCDTPHKHLDWIQDINEQTPTLMITAEGKNIEFYSALAKILTQPDPTRARNQATDIKAISH